MMLLASTTVGSSAKKLHRTVTLPWHVSRSASRAWTSSLADFKKFWPLSFARSPHFSTTDTPSLISSMAFARVLTLLTLAPLSIPRSSSPIRRVSSPCFPSPAIICTTRSITVVLRSVPLVRLSFNRLSSLIPDTLGRPMLSFIRFPTASTFFIKTPRFLLPTILSQADPIMLSLCFTSSTDSWKPRMTLNASQRLASPSTSPTALKKLSHLPSFFISPLKAITSRNSLSVGMRTLRLFTFSRLRLFSSNATTALTSILQSSPNPDLNWASAMHTL
mmetsp:Transcript_3924/g.7393  ORF Transcript_3924/g.7393 Transcript_3924/m.7393 type:complete len:276 (-) Transcript_3924:157-984(-)